MEVARCQSFSKAASHMYISQPAVSKQISLLEKSLSLTLVDRTPSGVQLTEAGKLFYRFFEKSYSDFHTIWDAAQRTSAQERQNIRLGSLDGWDMSSFASLQNLTKNSSRKVTLDGYNHIAILDALQNGAIDIAITLGIAAENQPDLSVQKLTSAPTVMLYSARNPVAQKDNITLKDFQNDPFFVISPTMGNDNPMEKLAIDVCREAGFTPDIEYVPSSAAILMRLQGGSGVQVTCSWTSACQMPLFRITPLNHMLDIVAVWVDNNDPPGKIDFVDDLCTHCGQLENQAVENI